MLYILINHGSLTFLVGAWRLEMLSRRNWDKKETETQDRVGKATQCRCTLSSAFWVHPWLIFHRLLYSNPKGWCEGKRLLYHDTKDNQNSYLLQYFEPSIHWLLSKACVGWCSENTLGQVSWWQPFPKPKLLLQEKKQKDAWILCLWLGLRVSTFMAQFNALNSA